MKTRITSARRLAAALRTTVAMGVWMALAATIVAPFGLSAQDAAEHPMRGGKKVLTIDEYSLWRSIGNETISPDGGWVTFSYDYRDFDEDEPMDPDRPLIIKRVPQGDSLLVVRGSNPAWSADSRWIAYRIDPEAGDDDAEPAVELRNLETGDTVRWKSARAFAFAEGGNALVVSKLPHDEDADHDGTDLIIRHLDLGMDELIAYVDEYQMDEAQARLAYTTDAPDGEANGVHLYEFQSRVRRELDGESGATYARLTWGGDEDEDDQPANDALAVLKGKDDDDLVERENALLMWPNISTSTTEIVIDPRPADDEDEGDEGDESEDDTEDEETEDAADTGPAPETPVFGFPVDRVLSENGGLRWAPDASRIFVQTRLQMPVADELCKPADEDDGDDEGEDEEEGDDESAGDDAEGDDGPRVPRMALRTGPDGRPLGPEEIDGGVCPEFVADVNIWHVDDPRIQSIQERSVNGDRNRTHTGVVHLENGTPRYVQLADSTMEDIQISDDGRTAIGSDDREYVSDWRPSYADYYLIDLDSGERELILERQLRTLGFDPAGDHFLYWKDADIWTYDIEADEHRNVTDATPVSFEDESFDRFGEKPPHGIAGWTVDGDPIMRTRWDLWLQPLDGGEPVNLTQGVGAEREIEFSIVGQLVEDEDEIDLDEPLVLEGFGEFTKDHGFWRLDGNDVESINYQAARFGSPMKADSADVLMFTRQTFEVFPDWHLTDLDFDQPLRITDANPQQSEYNWGRRILFDYTNADGITKQGTLAIPHDYQEGERRPMLINYYEQYSQNLHDYPEPRHSGSPNFAGYVSDGYLVMQPDIHFTIGPSHSDMLASIELALDAVIEMGYVDPDRVAVHGHSYSGQGSAYIATATDRFAAVVAGAAATNLVSDFNALWGGANNAHDYDIYGQGRLGTDPYTDFDLYVSQSPVHHAGSMDTPLLLLHGEDDSTVRFMHAVEFYNGLRWFDKNVILLSYPGEGHGLGEYENQKDFQIRMRQFLAHYLRDAPAASWMEDGRSYLQKERALDMLDSGNGNGSGGGNRRR